MRSLFSGLKSGPALLALALALSACDAGTSPQASVRYSVDGPAAITFTGSDGQSRSASVAAAWQTEVAVEPGTAVVLAATSTTGAPVTASIFVGDALVGSRRGRSVRVASSSDDSGSEVEVRGPVEALGADRVTVAGRVFVVDASTRLYDHDDSPVPLATFAVGTYVEAEGRPLGDGTFLASKVKLEDESNSDDDGDDDDDGQEVEVHGSVQAIDGASMTVGGRRFLTGPATRYLDDDGNTLSRDAFRVGDLVEVEGYALADGTVQARKIQRDDDY